MSPSSDIETLFGHFGGNAGDYQEIGRENEARSARTRWPLLVTLELTQPVIPAITQRRDPVAKHVDESGQAQAPHGDAQATETPTRSGGTGSPAVHSKTTLFARPHRRIRPVANAIKPDAPRGAARFSAAPEAVGAIAGEGEPVVGPVRMSAPPAMPPLSMRLAVPVAVPTRPHHSAVTASTASAPAQPPVILGKLFSSAAPSTTPPAQPPASDASSTALHLVFDRLRGVATTPAAPAPHSWLVNGPRRS